MADKKLYAATVVVLDIVAAAIVFSSFAADTSEADFKSAMAQGADLESRQLYGRAVNAYRAADKIHDSADLRLKVAELYGKGYENGEFATLEYRKNALRSVIRDYLDNERVLEAYDGLADIFNKEEDYEKLANLVKHARANGKNSDTLTSAYEDVKHRYTLSSLNVDMLESVGPYWIGRKAEEINEENGENPINQFTFYYENGENSDTYYSIEMSAPTDIKIDEENSFKYYFKKNYGNDSDTLEKNDEIYSAIYRDGVRRTYIDGDREGWYQFGSGMISLFDKSTGKWDVFNYEGEVKGSGYDTAGTFGNGFMYAEKDGKSRIIDTSFNDIFGEDMLAVTGFGGRCSINNRMFLKKKGENKYTMYDSSGSQPVAMSFSCDNADLFIENLAAFSNDGKWGFVDSTGNVVIEPKYDEAKSFHNGYAAVKENGVWGFINKNGEMIIEPQFEDAYYFRQKGKGFIKNEGAYSELTLFYTEEVSGDGVDQK